MNFLAHLYLSGDNDLIKIGNFMADGIRGKQFEHFDIEIQKGILLHRYIDSFTDAHPIFRKSTKRLHSKYHHYSGIIVDIFYDHFLAKNWPQYANESLFDFTNRFYRSLTENSPLLNEKTQKMMPYLMAENWLLSYQTIDGIAIVLQKMDRRLNNISNMAEAVTELEQFYTQFDEEFSLFFCELISVCKTKLESL